MARPTATPFCAQSNPCLGALRRADLVMCLLDRGPWARRSRSNVKGSQGRTAMEQCFPAAGGSTTNATGNSKAAEIIGTEFNHFIKKFEQRGARVPSVCRRTPAMAGAAWTARTRRSRAARKNELPAGAALSHSPMMPTCRSSSTSEGVPHRTRFRGRTAFLAAVDRQDQGAGGAPSRGVRRPYRGALKLCGSRPRAGRCRGCKITTARVTAEGVVHLRSPGPSISFPTSARIPSP